MSYAEGFEDATELCLAELKKAKSLQDAEVQCRKIVEVVNARKIDRIKSLLAIL